MVYGLGFLLDWGSYGCSVLCSVDENSWVLSWVNIIKETIQLPNSVVQLNASERLLQTARCHLQHPATAILSRSTTSDDDLFRKYSRLSAKQPYELTTHATYYVALKVTPAGACISETLWSETNGGARNEMLPKSLLRYIDKHFARCFHSLTSCR